MTDRRHNFRRRVERAEEHTPRDPTEVVVVWDDRHEEAEPGEEEGVETPAEKRPKQDRKGRSKSEPADRE